VLNLSEDLIRDQCSSGKGAAGYTLLYT